MKEGGGDRPKTRAEADDALYQASPAVPSTQASPVVWRESSNPSVGVGTQICAASLYKAMVDAPAQWSPSIFVRSASSMSSNFTRWRRFGSWLHCRWLQLASRRPAVVP